jgi:DNA mismatch repair protein MLH1
MPSRLAKRKSSLRACLRFFKKCAHLTWICAKIDLI